LSIRWLAIVKTLIFGARGFLGGEFIRHLDLAVGSEADIADARQVAAELDRVQPEVVINYAGKTGRPNIDWCEDHREATIRSNVTGPLVLLDECLRRELYFVHFGSGCVYEGDNQGRGFTEQDPPNFFGSFYSRTKVWSDSILAEFPVLILRVRMPFDNSLHPRTLIGKLVKYRQVLDAANSITYIPDLLLVAKQLIEQRCEGIYHLVNPGVISPLQIMRRYVELVDPRHECESISPGELDAITSARRSNCQLSTEKLRRCGLQLRPIEEAIDVALNSIAKDRQDAVQQS
jgi:dTDP-4-dehydrorhamnose reductase